MGKVSIDVVISHPYIEEEMLLGKTVILIDTLRATSVIVTALMNGAERVYPVKETAEALALKETLKGEADVLLGGERKGLKIEGFDLANSPLEYTKAAVFGKTLIMSTTNGTRTMEKCFKADEVIIGCLLNASAAAKTALMTGRDILIVNSGTNGKFTMDDFITAGCMVSAMKQQNPESALSDLAAAAQLVYQAHPDIVSAMADCYHYNYLQSIGLTGDLAYCLQRDLTDTVPVLKNGIITAG